MLTWQRQTFVRSLSLKTSCNQTLQEESKKGKLFKNTQPGRPGDMCLSSQLLGRLRQEDDKSRHVWAASELKVILRNLIRHYFP